MRKEIADLVFPVLRHAIELKDRLQANEVGLTYAESQKKLLGLLNAPVSENLRSDVIGEGRSLDGATPSAKLGYGGVRYALACWLDEIFIRDTAWQDEFNRNKMEFALYRVAERAQEFWRQAERAQNRPTRDTLEVYYLCVMAGFRGEMYERPEELAGWRDRVEAQITQDPSREYTPPPPVAVTPDVQHQLQGAAIMQAWQARAIGAALMFIPLLIIWAFAKS